MANAAEPCNKALSQRDAFAWIEGAIGEKLLAYLLGCDVAALPALRSDETALDDKQREVVGTLLSVGEHIPKEFDEANTQAAVQNFVTQITEDGRSVARAMREHVVGTEDIPSGRDDLERALAALAVDGYPACLLPPDPRLPPQVQRLGPYLTSSLFRHPQGKAFTDAVSRDPVFKNVFTEGEEGIERFANISQNTGSGGWLQLVMFSELLLQSAWRKLESEKPARDTFVTAALDQLRFVRGAFAGEECTITAKLAFTGILLPSDKQLTLSDGIVHSINEADRRYAPESLQARLEGTDSSGAQIVVNYDGDVIFDYQFPYRVETQPRSEELPSPSPLMLRSFQALERTVTLLRFSLVLAAQRNHRVQLIPTWRAFDNPLSHGMATSWSDPRQGAGFTPTQLTDTEADAWREWYGKLSQTYVSKIELAISRILRAMAERREPSDVLVDSVIAWENIFGTKEGEPTFRITMCLARLLERDSKARLALKTKLGKIYALRSKVVHGSGVLKQEEYPLCQEALDVAIRAVKVLVSQRTDLLKLRDGADRSAVLLLEA